MRRRCVQRANELRAVMPELARVSGPMPAVPLHDDILRMGG